MGQQRRLLKPPTDEEAKTLPQMPGFFVKPTPPPPGDDQRGFVERTIDSSQKALRGLQGTPVGRKVSDVSYGLGVTPSQIGENVQGLLQMFTQNPLTTADQLTSLFADPIRRAIDDPKVRKGLIHLIQNNGLVNLGGTGFDPKTAIEGATGIPGIGNQFVDPLTRIESGDEGGYWQALGAGAQVPAAVTGPAAARAVTGGVTGKIADRLNTAGRRRLVDTPADLPLDVAREGVEAGFNQGLFRGGLRAGQDQAKILAEKATNRAIDAAQPGAVSQPSRPTMMGNLFGRAYNAVRPAATPFLNPDNPFGGGGPTRLTPFPPTQSIGTMEATGNALADQFAESFGAQRRFPGGDAATTDAASRPPGRFADEGPPPPDLPMPTSYRERPFVEPPELPEPPPVTPTPPPTPPGMELPGTARRELPYYPGTEVTPANPMMPPVRMSGPGAGVTFSENVEGLINNPRIQPEQVSFIEEVVTAAQNDPRRLGLTPADRIRFAEGARFSEGDVGNTARTLGRGAFAADERAAIRSAAPATTRHLDEIDEIDKAQRLFAMSSPEPLTGTMTSELKRLKYPLFQTAYDVGVRAPRAVAPKMGELVRLAILAQLANGQQPPER